ncbi:FAD-binding oxidoreductase [Corticibacterium sp. UT-5YL-CI-8]|nr:FAD-binding oxidoreductase [Tianweitania sp. UT-5YL-CI-8]
MPTAAATNDNATAISAALPQGLLKALAAALPAEAVLTGDSVDARYSEAQGDKKGIQPLLVLRPKTTAEVSTALSICNAHGQRLVTQGGRTGLSSSARVCEGEAVLSLERMTALDPVDSDAGTIIVDAGVALQTLQEAADAAGLMFGVDIGARGSATVGGNVATNAGGIRVLRYGMYRAQILGLEAVLADGTVLSSLKGLAKDNSGYDLNQLFIGSEGTLGVVTRACLKLHPKPLYESNAFCALPSVEAAITLLSRLRSAMGPMLSAFEIIFPAVYESALRFSGKQRPVQATGDVYVLAEIQGTKAEVDNERFAEALIQACEDEIVSDVTVSQSPREFRAIWELREACSHYISSCSNMVGCDISVALREMPGFLSSADIAVRTADENASFNVFGHLGDGNLHYIVGTEKPDAVTDAILSCVQAANGSISAEHGIGLDKKQWLHLCRSDAEIAAMRRLKAAFDPNGILNTGRIFDMPAQQPPEKDAQA